MNTRRKLLGQRLRCARERSNLSQGDAADALGVTRQAISSWETGRSTPSATQLGELAAAYCECAHTLLFGAPFRSIGVAAMAVGRVAA